MTEAPVFPPSLLSTITSLPHLTSLPLTTFPPTTLFPLPHRRKLPHPPGLWCHRRLLPQGEAAGGHPQVPGALAAGGRGQKGGRQAAAAGGSGRGGGESRQRGQLQAVAAGEGAGNGGNARVRQQVGEEQGGRWPDDVRLKAGQARKRTRTPTQLTRCSLCLPSPHACPPSPPSPASSHSCHAPLAVQFPLFRKLMWYAAENALARCAPGSRKQQQRCAADGLRLLAWKLCRLPLARAVTAFRGGPSWLAWLCLQFVCPSRSRNTASCLF